MHESNLLKHLGFKNTLIMNDFKIHPWDFKSVYTTCVETLTSGFPIVCVNIHYKHWILFCLFIDRHKTRKSKF